MDEKAEISRSGLSAISCILLFFIFFLVTLFLVVLLVFFSILFPSLLLVCMVGVSGAPLELPSGPFIMKEMRFAGSLVAGRQGLHDMLQFAALHKIEPMIEPIPFSPEGIEKAIQRVDNNTVRYRAVLYHPDCPGAPGAK